MSFRWISAGAVASGVLLLSGCVAVPGSYGYDNSTYYSQPSYPAYYNEPAPVVVSPSVYLQGGTYYDRGYYARDNRRNYDGRDRGYDGGRRYDGRGPDRSPRPAPAPRQRANPNLPGQSPSVTGYPPFQSPADLAAQRSGPRQPPRPVPGDQP